MLQPFHSPPTCVLFSWMYLQTLRNIYRFLQIAPTQQQLFAELFGKAAAKATKDKATKMTSSFLFIKNQFGTKKKKKKLWCWVFKSTLCGRLVSYSAFYNDNRNVLFLKASTSQDVWSVLHIFIKRFAALQLCLQFQGDTVESLRAEPLRRFQLVKWFVQQTGGSIKFFQMHNK